MTDARPVPVKPIIFSGPMVRAILEGRKSQTRRLLKPQPNSGPDGKMVNLGSGSWGLSDGILSGEWKLASPGDRLWVREAWAKDGDCPLQYRAGPHVADDALGVRWRPSIHMPRWASRITLEVTEVRVQRLQDISEEDARAEGVRGNASGPWGCEGVIEDFSDLWESIHGPGSWDANPWVAAITFKRIKP